LARRTHVPDVALDIPHGLPLDRVLPHQLLLARLRRRVTHAQTGHPMHTPVVITHAGNWLPLGKRGRFYAPSACRAALLRGASSARRPAARAWTLAPRSAAPGTTCVCTRRQPSEGGPCSRAHASHDRGCHPSSARRSLFVSRDGPSTERSVSCRSSWRRARRGARQRARRPRAPARAAWLADPLRWRAIGRIGEEAMAHRTYNGPTCKGIQRADM